ncbi:MAG: hypothetical protein BWZ03_00390 [bacterium ADurb.BinA186]|nr:MAG: hypothetical protein BWZ03_00390 [bacterium ADurb.BinA186]
MTKRLLKLWLGIAFLGSTISCLHENNDTMRDKMCPSDGANLYLKCSDGREKVFGIGYADEPIYVRKEGEWILKNADKFCTDDPAEMIFYFRNGHLRVSGRKANGTWISIWRTAHSNCIPFEHKINMDSLTLKLDSIPSTTTKPEDEPEA